MNEEAVVLSARNVSIDYQIGKRWLNVIHDVSLDLHANRTHGLVGESASGKSTLALALMCYLAANGRVTAGTIHYEGRNLLELAANELRQLWGSKMSLVPQNALSALNPSYTIGEQMGEVTRTHLGISRRESGLRAAEMLRSVRIADVENVLRSYPFQLSGGMLQRVSIGMALSVAPSLLVLDEPTTALDVTTQAVILDLFRELIDRHDATALYVSHDLGTVAQFCDAVTVLYGGEVMESAPVKELYANPKHPYTQGLLASLPARANAAREQRIHTIEGVAPSLAHRSPACVFAERCKHAIDRCHAEKPPLEHIGGRQTIRCFRWQEIVQDEVTSAANQGAAEPVVRPQIDLPRKNELLTTHELTKKFGKRNALLRWLGKEVIPLHALDRVSITVNKGNTLGIVGESGSGKSTLARVLVALETADSGSIELLGENLSYELSQREPSFMASMRLIPQNPDASLNPYITVGSALERTLKVLAERSKHSENWQQAELSSKHGRWKRVHQLLKAVGLEESYRQRYPNQLSGGEKQRVAIARAFASDPALIIADEPTSSLDVSVQAVVLNLLKDLRETQEVAYIFISHDMDVIRYVADWICVMYLGQIVEEGSNEQLYAAPSHPYTEALFSAIPEPNPLLQKKHIRLEGELPSARNLPSGCPFHTRCPRKIGEICETDIPPIRPAGVGHFIRCHIEVDELSRLQSATEEDLQP